MTQVTFGVSDNETKQESLETIGIAESAEIWM